MPPLKPAINSTTSKAAFERILIFGAVRVIRPKKEIPYNRRKPTGKFLKSRAGSLPANRRRPKRSAYIP